MSRMQEQIGKQSPHTFVGIDVGKDKLDIFIHPTGIKLETKNEKKAINALIKKLDKYDVQLVTLEATSKYHRLAHIMLHDAGIHVSVVKTSD